MLKREQVEYSRQLRNESPKLSRFGLTHNISVITNRVNQILETGRTISSESPLDKKIEVADMSQLQIDLLCYDILVARKEGFELPLGIQVKMRSSHDPIHPYSQNEVLIGLPLYYYHGHAVDREAFLAQTQGARRHRSAEADLQRTQVVLRTTLGSLAREYGPDRGFINSYSVYTDLVTGVQPIGEEDKHAITRKMREVKDVDGRERMQINFFGRQISNDEIKWLHRVKHEMIIYLLDLRVQKGENDMLSVQREEGNDDWLRITVQVNPREQLTTQVKLSGVQKENPEIYEQIMRFLSENSFDGTYVYVPLEQVEKTETNENNE